MKLKELKEKHVDLVDQFEKELSKDNSDNEKLENLKTNIEKVNSDLSNERYLDDQRKARISDQEKEEKFNESNAKDSFRFTEALNFLDNPMNIASDKRDFYADVNSSGKTEAKASGVSLQGGNSLVIPSNVFKNAVDVSTEGDDLLFDQEGGFISALRDKMVLSDLGAQFLSGLTGNVRMPKQTGEATFKWVGETTDAGNDDTVYGSVELTPKRGYAGVPVSNQMLAQQSLSMENMLREDIMSSVAHGIQDAAINSGTTNGPNGILDVASEVTTGSSLYEQVVNLEAAVSGSNIESGSFGYLMDTQGRADAKTELKDAGSGRFVWEQGNTVNGYPTGITNAVAADQLIFGAFNNLVIGDFAGVEILKNPYVSASAGLTIYQVNVYVGTAFRHDEAFAYVDNSPAG